MTIYRQLTLEDRIRIGELRLQGFSVARIAESLGRHRSTIYRELQRNCCHVTDGAYRPSKAERRTRARRSRSRRNSHFTEDDFKLVRACLRRKSSPEQISGALKVSGELSISHERIYQYVWCDKWLGGHLWTHLRQSTKLRRKRYGSYDSRCRTVVVKLLVALSMFTRPVFPVAFPSPGSVTRCLPMTSFEYLHSSAGDACLARPDRPYDAWPGFSHPGRCGAGAG